MAPYTIVFEFIPDSEALVPAVRSEATTPNRAAAFALSLDRPEALNQKRGVVISNGFGVGLGPPVALRLLQSPGLAEEEEEGEEGGVQAAAAACVGGMAFASPPVVEVVDAGGNRLVTDYDSAVEVSVAYDWCYILETANDFYDPPAGVRFSLTSCLFSLLHYISTCLLLAMSFLLTS